QVRQRFELSSGARGILGRAIALCFMLVHGYSPLVVAGPGELPLSRANYLSPGQLPPASFDRLDDSLLKARHLQGSFTLLLAEPSHRSNSICCGDWPHPVALIAGYEKGIVSAHLAPPQFAFSSRQMRSPFLKYLCTS